MEQCHEDIKNYLQQLINETLFSKPLKEKKMSNFQKFLKNFF